MACPFGLSQPDWRAAFELIENRVDSGGGHWEGVDIISPYPLMHDLYLGPDRGVKHYIPISFGGHPGGVSWSPAHTKAHTIHSLAKLKASSGYILMDDMALRMVGDPEIAQFLKQTPPDAIIADRFKILVWLLDRDTREKPGSRN
jgi:hypothetical protein